MGRRTKEEELMPCVGRIEIGGYTLWRYVGNRFVLRDSEGKGGDADEQELRRAVERVFQTAFPSS